MCLGSDEDLAAHGPDSEGVRGAGIVVASSVAFAVLVFHDTGAGSGVGVAARARWRMGGSVCWSA